MKTIIKNTMVEPIEMTCDECKSVFSYNYQDIDTEVNYPLFSFGVKHTRFVICPVCKYKIDLDRIEVEVEKESKVSE